MTDDSKTEAAWTDFDKLVETYLSATKTILQKDKFVIPMAVILNKDDEPEFIGLQPEDGSKTVEIAEHLVAYRELLRQHPGNTKAALLGYDIRISLPGYTDALALELEHANGALLKMVVPHRFSGLLKKKLELGQAKLAEAEDAHILSR